MTQSEELIKRTEVHDSPFTIIGIDGKYFGSMGKYRITESYDTEDEAYGVTEKITWNRIVQVIAIMLDKQEELANFLKEQEENEN